MERRNAASSLIRVFTTRRKHHGLSRQTHCPRLITSRATGLSSVSAFQRECHTHAHSQPTLVERVSSHIAPHATTWFAQNGQPVTSQGVNGSGRRLCSREALCQAEGELRVSRKSTTVAHVQRVMPPRATVQQLSCECLAWSWLSLGGNQQRRQRFLGSNTQVPVWLTTLLKMAQHFSPLCSALHVDGDAPQLPKCCTSRSQLAWETSSRRKRSNIQHFGEWQTKFPSPSWPTQILHLASCRGQLQSSRSVLLKDPAKNLAAVFIVAATYQPTSRSRR